MMDENEQNDVTEIRSWLKNIRAAAEHREMIDLAVLVREIASRGESERTLCKEILEAISHHSRINSETSFLSF
jgi:hypothetical protein